MHRQDLLFEDDCTFFTIWFDAKDTEARPKLSVVAPVTAGPKNAVPGAAQLVRIDNKNIIKYFIK